MDEVISQSLCILSFFLAYSSDLFIPTDSRFNSFHGSSQTGLFQQFLLRANKYNRLQMSGEKVTEDRKIILIEVLHRTALQKYHYDVEKLFFLHISKIHYTKEKELGK